MKLTLCILAFFILSALAAGQAAKQLPLSLTIKAYESTWPANATGEIRIEATLRNVSHHTLTLLPGRRTIYTYEVKRDGVVVPETDAGRKFREEPEGQPMIDSTFRPNQTARDDIPINQFRDMSQPGTYTIQVFWPMNWANPAEGIVKSNIITVTVRP
jgi:hypothetical protein